MNLNYEVDWLKINFFIGIENYRVANGVLWSIPKQVDILKIDDIKWNVHLAKWERTRKWIRYIPSTI